VAEDRKDDGYEFTPPDFDEDAFIHRELVSFKTTAILFVWGIVAAAVSWAAFLAVGGTDLGWFLGLLVCAGFGYALRFLFPRLGADVAHFKRKEWVGTGFLFFFTWLSFFVLVVNPPVTDIAPPQVFVYASPPVQEAGAPVTVEVLATDNGRVAKLDVTATRDGAPLTLPLESVGPDHLRATLPTAAGRYAITATATDGKGHTGRQVTNVTVGHVLDVNWPSGNRLDEAIDQVLVKASAGSQRIPPCAADYDKGRTFDCIRAMELRASDGSPSVPFEYSDQDGGWRATPNFPGWALGNHTYQAVAHYPTHFLGTRAVPGGELLGAKATLEVRIPAGDHQVATIPEPTQRAVQVPGLPVGLLAVGLLGIALLLRRRTQ
jgi:hypothetical protein